MPCLLSTPGCALEREATRNRSVIDRSGPLDLAALEHAWYASFQYSRATKPWPGRPDKCLDCGGKLIEVTW